MTVNIQTIFMTKQHKTHDCKYTDHFYDTAAIMLRHFHHSPLPLKRFCNNQFQMAMLL